MPSPQSLQTLKALQGIDSEIHALEKERTERPRTLEFTKQELARRRANLDTKKNEVLAHKKEIQKKEMGVKEGEERIAKLTGQLNTAKTNKEYSTLQQEINGVKADNSLLEEEQLVLMGRVESAETEAKQLQKLVDETERNIAIESERIGKELAELGKKVDSLREERTHLSATVERVLLRAYERIQKNKPNGVAIAKVVDSICQGCFMSITSQDLNEIMKNRETIFCKSCNRILYL